MYFKEFPCIFGTVLGIGGFYVLRYILKKIWSRWTLIETLIHPGTGTSYEIKERKGRFRYYVNSIRVPSKFYGWILKCQTIQYCKEICHAEKNT